MSTATVHNPECTWRVCHLSEIVAHLEFVLLVRQVGLHIGVGVVDDGEEHVEKHEEYEEYVQDEVRWT